MSYADRNTLIEKITSLKLIHLDIHNAKNTLKRLVQVSLSILY